MAHLLQDRYSALVDAKLRATLVTKDHIIFNTKYEGNPTAGAVKIPVRDTEATVANYNKASGTSLNQGATAYITATIDKDYAINELIDGYEAAAVPDGLVADRLDSAGYALAEKEDSDGLAALYATKTAVSDSSSPINGKKATTITFKAGTDSIFDKAVDARTAMGKAKVPGVGRYMIVAPEIYSALLKDKDNFVKKGDLSQKLVETGAIGEVAGFAVYESNNLPSGCLAIFGHPDFATRIDEYQVPVHLQDLSASGTFIGASAVQGRMVCTHKVTKPQAFVIMEASV